MEKDKRRQSTRKTVHRQKPPNSQVQRLPGAPMSSQDEPINQAAPFAGRLNFGAMKLTTQFHGPGSRPAAVGRDNGFLMECGVVWQSGSAHICRRIT